MNETFMWLKLEPYIIDVDMKLVYIDKDMEYVSCLILTYLHVHV